MVTSNQRGQRCGRASFQHLTTLEQRAIGATVAVYRGVSGQRLGARHDPSFDKTAVVGIKGSHLEAVERAPKPSPLHFKSNSPSLNPSPWVQRGVLASHTARSPDPKGQHVKGPTLPEATMYNSSSANAMSLGASCRKRRSNFHVMGNRHGHAAPANTTQRVPAVRHSSIKERRGVDGQCNGSQNAVTIGKASFESEVRQAMPKSVMTGRPDNSPFEL